jgi:hypothetical protein
MTRLRPVLVLAACLALPLAGCSAAQSGEDSAWAGATCTAVANAYLATTLLANDVPPPEALTDDNLPLYQARLGDEISQTSSAITSVDTQLASVPSSLSGDVASLTQPAADLSAAFTASGEPLAGVTSALDAKAAEAAMPPAAEATTKTQAAAVALAQAVLALNSNDAFSSASSCQLPSPTPVPS